MSQPVSDEPAASRRRDWTERLARHRTGLAALSFAESTVVPIPLETLVVPLMVGHPRRALTIAVAIWAGSILGAALFYWIGFFLADPVVLPTLDALGLRSEFDELRGRMEGDGFFWTIFVVSFSPIPMQLATLGGGISDGSFATFLAAIALSRGLRYFGLAILAQILGQRAARMGVSKRRLILITFAVLAVGWTLIQIV